MSIDETTGVDTEPLEANLATNADLVSPEFAGLDFDCPRCSKPITARFYGPCESCREELRAKYVVEIKEVETEKFEPKMNVTPNAVASKD